jgi:predicted permease
VSWRQRLTDLRLRLQALWSGRRLDRELDEELGFHLEMATERNLRRGMAPEEARRAAVREFGGVERHRERARDERGVRFLETLAFDLRLGARSLRRTPAVTGAALVTVALAVGATTLIWAVVDAVLLRPLPYREPERLVQLWESHPEQGPRVVVSRGNYLDWLERAEAFEALGAYMPGWGRGLTGDGPPVQVTTALVTPSLLRLLQVEAAEGRTFAEAEGEPGKDDAALLSEGFWRRRFGGDPEVLGRTLTLDGESYRVVGVMPAGFDVPTREVDVWLPMSFPPAYYEQREAHTLHVVGRLAPGTSVEAADAAMDRLARSLGEEHPEEVAGWEVTVVPLHEQRVGEIRPALLILLGAVAVLLAAACFNVANLLLARGTARAGEVAVRSAVGASRGRLVRQLLTESLLLAAAGGAVGAGLAFGGLEVLRSSLAAQIPRLADAVLDLRVLAVAAALSLATGAAVGALPAIRDSRADLRGSLSDGAAFRGQAPGRDRLRQALVAVQVALAVVLLAGSGLLLRSFLAVRSVDPGFETEGLLAVSLNLPGSSYPDTPDHTRFYEDLLERLARLPGAAAVAATSEPPVVGYNMTRTPVLEGAAGEWRGQSPPHRIVTVGYFETLGIPLVAGRSFDRFDRPGSPLVLVVNEAMARQLWPGEEPLGKRLAFDLEGPWHQVVGVVGDTRDQGLEAPADPAIYAPLAQKGWHWMTWMTVLVRTGGDPHALADAVRDEVWALDPTLPVLATRTVEEVYAESRARRRFHTLLFSLFAGFGLVLGLVGLYGVTAFAVARRTREIGIRMALGARRGNVAAMVLRQGAALTALGLAAGTAAALALSRTLSSLLFGVGPHDPATFAAIVALLAAAALAACYLPARRAARLDPTRALR